MQQEMDDGDRIDVAAANVDYDMKNETMVFTGNVVIKQSRGSINGERVVYNLKSGQLQKRWRRWCGRVKMRILPKDTAAPAAPSSARARPDAGRRRPRAQTLSPTRSRARFRSAAKRGGSGRFTGPQRCRQDHMFLHDRGVWWPPMPGASCWMTPTSPTCRCMPARAWAWLSAAGAVGLSQIERGRQYPSGAGVASGSDDDGREHELNSLLDELQIGHAVTEQPGASLSGGERRRGNCPRLAGKPRMILLDEPFAGGPHFGQRNPTHRATSNNAASAF